jgi:hypothetical protein
MTASVLRAWKRRGCCPVPVHLIHEIHRTFEDIDQMEKELKKAAKAIECAKDLASA